MTPVREQGPSLTDRNVVLIFDIKLQSKLHYTTISNAQFYVFLSSFVLQKRNALLLQTTTAIILKKRRAIYYYYINAWIMSITTYTHMSG